MARSTRSHLRAYSLTASKLPVLAFFLLWREIPAMEKVAQSGDAQITSGAPNIHMTSRGFRNSMSACRSAGSDSSHSTEKTSWPRASKALPMERVPLKSSRTFIGLLRI